MKFKNNNEATSISNLKRPKGPKANRPKGQKDKRTKGQKDKRTKGQKAKRPKKQMKFVQDYLDYNIDHYEYISWPKGPIKAFVG